MPLSHLWARRIWLAWKKFWDQKRARTCLSRASIWPTRSQAVGGTCPPAGVTWHGLRNLLLCTPRSPKTRRAAGNTWPLHNSTSSVITWRMHLALFIKARWREQSTAESAVIWDTRRGLCSAQSSHSVKGGCLTYKPSESAARSSRDQEDKFLLLC